MNVVVGVFAGVEAWGRCGVGVVVVVVCGGMVWKNRISLADEEVNKRK